MYSNNDGLLIQARQNPFTFKIILAIAAILLIGVIIYFILRNIRNIHSSPEWIEAHKTTLTTYKNIKEVAKLANLTPEERDFLWKICKKYKARNIRYLLRDNDSINTIFKQEYQDLCQVEKSENHKAMLFTLRFKLEKLHDTDLFINSTKNIQVGQEFNLLDKSGTAWVLKLIENNPRQGLTVEVPEGLVVSADRPDTLSKIMLTFTADTGVEYEVFTRIIRYGHNIRNQNIMFLSQADIKWPLKRRMAKRMSVLSKCSFSAVKKNEVKRKKDKPFIVMENKYPGVLVDISSTGCCLECMMPIKKGQLIHIDFTLDDVNYYEAIGTIVVTKKSKYTNAFVLHIQFIDIDLITRNKVYATIYQYDED